jgi:DNA gyrase subunit B
MYIGSTGAPGCTTSSTRSSTTRSTSARGFCDQVNVTIHIDSSITVVDNGRGIPSISTQRQVAAKSSDCSACRRQVRQRQLQSVGWSARRRRVGGQRPVGAARSRDLAQRQRLPAKLRARNSGDRSRGRGHDAEARHEGDVQARRQIFETTEYSFDTLAQRLRELAFLNGGILITIDDERDGKNHKFQYEGGIVSFVQHLNKNKAVVNDKPIFMKGEKDGIDAEIALQWNDATPSWCSRSRTTSTRTKAARTCPGFRSALTRRSMPTPSRTTWQRT